MRRLFGPDPERIEKERRELEQIDVLGNAFYTRAEAKNERHANALVELRAGRDLERMTRRD